MKLESGQNLELVMNELGLALAALDFGRIQVNGLTPNVKRLFGEMKEDFGAPSMNDVHAENLAKIPNAIVRYNWSTLLLGIVFIFGLIIFKYFIH